MEEIEAIKLVAQALDKLSTDERDRVLLWASAKYGSGVSAASSQVGPKEQLEPTVKGLEKNVSGKASKAVSAGKAPKKAKTIISMDKSLNLVPPGKMSAVEFAQSKAPSAAKQKCVVAVVYLREVIGLEAVSVSAVFTYFKTVGWPVPADLRNMLAQAGSAGWLDTSDGNDIKVTAMGDNLVEHKLPHKPKA